MKAIIYLQRQLGLIFSFILVLGLAAGCASVTDANLDSLQAEEAQEAPAEAAPENIWLEGGGDDMDPFRPAPPGGDD